MFNLFSTSSLKFLQQQLCVLLILLCFNINNSNSLNYYSNAPEERTFIMCKPDAAHRGIIHEVIKRFENKGLKLVAMKMIKGSKATLEEHYGHLKSEPFFQGLISYMSSGPIIPMVWEGNNAVKFGRDIIGKTDPLESGRGTIRGDFCVSEGNTVVHGANTVESAKKEISLWFKNEEFIDWEPALSSWISF